MFFENTKYHTRQKIAESFNSYFANIGRTISKNIPNVTKSFNDYLSNKNTSTLFLKPTNQI